MGFSVAAAQCLVAPPYIFAGLLMIVMAWIGDKYRTRGPLLVVGAVIGLIGLPLLVREKVGNILHRNYFNMIKSRPSLKRQLPAILAYFSCAEVAMEVYPLAWHGRYVTGIQHTSRLTLIDICASAGE